LLAHLLLLDALIVVGLAFTVTSIVIKPTECRECYRK